MRMFRTFPDGEGGWVAESMGGPTTYATGLTEADALRALAGIMSGPDFEAAEIVHQSRVAVMVPDLALAVKAQQPESDRLALALYKRAISASGS